MNHDSALALHFKKQCGTSRLQRGKRRHFRPFQSVACA